ncbi:MAG: CoA pyrophosphatase [Chloroflexi bacterium]|nr:CoA pyrophosphatase [Chloroflexota bacterium]
MHLTQGTFIQTTSEGNGREQGLGGNDTTLEALRRLLGLHSTSDLGDSTLVPSAVLLAVFQKGHVYHTLVNRRSQQVAHHKGEWCFPGGAMDPEDKDLLTTALREAQEEMGIDPRDVVVLGTMPPVATRSGFKIQPIVGTLPYPYPFRVSQEEISEVLEVPVEALLDPATHRQEAYLRNNRLEKSLAFTYNSRTVFGATARIIREFLDFFQQAKGEAVWPLHVTMPSKT